MTTITTPTTFKKIKALRQQGQLEEAYRQARKCLVTDADNIWNRRAMAWVYADRLKAIAEQGSAAQLTHGLRHCMGLALPKDETLWQQQVLWAVNRFLLHTPPDKLTFQELAEIVRLSFEFLGETPSLGRSVWLKALLKHTDSGLEWQAIMQQWGWPMFRPEDFQPDVLPDGQKMPSLAERVGVAFSRQVIHQTPVLETVVRPLLQQLHRIAQYADDTSFLVYYQAQLLHLIGDSEEALTIILPFARKKSPESWMWELLADIVTEKTELSLACLVKAVSVGKKEAFLVKIRQKLAKRLVACNRWPEAKYEIEQLVGTRKAEDWKIPPTVLEWTNNDAYTSAERVTNAWYADYLPIAEQLLFSDLPLEIGLVAAINQEREMAQLCLRVDWSVWFPYKRFVPDTRVGDRLCVRMIEKQGGAWRILTAAPSNQPLSRLKTRTVKGTLRLSDKGFGFVEQVFVPKALANEHNWVGEIVEVEAVEAIDARKQQSGWCAFRINKV